MRKKRGFPAEVAQLQKNSIEEFFAPTFDIKSLRRSFRILDPFILQGVHINFLKELEKSYKGEKTSLPFIIHSLPAEPFIQEHGLFQVMVIGGSVFKQALVRKDLNGLHIIDSEKAPLPKFHTKADLLQLIERHLREDVSVLAINFAYPLSPVFRDGLLDGKLLSAMKEHTFDGLIGESVGREIETYFKKTKNRNIRVSVANDTVCLLLSGLTKYSNSEIAGGIVGTGTNFALFLDSSRLVNLESANFDKFPISSEAIALDELSAQPGKALFEKETAGAYLYHHFNSLLSKYGIPYQPIDSTWSLKKLAKQNAPIVSSLAALLVEKSAALMAAKMAAIAVFTGNLQTVFVMEGSFFWEGDIYKDFVEKHLSILLQEHGIKFVLLEDSPYLGAAKLVA